MYICAHATLIHSHPYNAIVQAASISTPAKTQIFAFLVDFLIHTMYIHQPHTSRPITHRAEQLLQRNGPRCLGLRRQGRHRFCRWCWGRHRRRPRRCRSSILQQGPQGGGGGWRHGRVGSGPRRRAQRGVDHESVDAVGLDAVKRDFLRHDGCATSALLAGQCLLLNRAHI